MCLSRVLVMLKGEGVYSELMWYDCHLTLSFSQARDQRYSL